MSKTIKRLVIIMGILTFLSGLFGCSRGGDTKQGNTSGQNLQQNSQQNPTPEADGYVLGIEGDDFSEDGPGEYLKVVGCEFSVGGSEPGFCYSIAKSEEDSRTMLYLDDQDNSIRELECEVDDATMENLSQLVAQLNVRSWDRFSRSDNDVLDGSGFSLYVYFEDGSSIHAQGSNAFPKNYWDFEKQFREVMSPVVEAQRAVIREAMYEQGLYSAKLEMAMINYRQQGASGSDAYRILIRDSESLATKVDVTVNSKSGEFVPQGDYRYFGDLEGTDEVLAKIQEVIEKYSLYKWDGYYGQTTDSNNSEWFQLDFCYPEANIDSMGYRNMENYAEVRQELLTIVMDYVKDYLEVQ